MSKTDKADGFLRLAPRCKFSGWLSFFHDTCKILRYTEHLYVCVSFLDPGLAYGTLLSTQVPTKSTNVDLRSNLVWSLAKLSFNDPLLLESGAAHDASNSCFLNYGAVIWYTMLCYDMICVTLTCLDMVWLVSNGLNTCFDFAWSGIAAVSLKTAHMADRQGLRISTARLLVCCLPELLSLMNFDSVYYQCLNMFGNFDICF